jgi:hypothetical protein
MANEETDSPTVTGTPAKATAARDSPPSSAGTATKKVICNLSVGPESRRMPPVSMGTANHSNGGVEDDPEDEQLNPNLF